MSYLDAFLNLPFTNELEKDLILEAKEAIRKGKFQNLQRDLNKLQKAVKKTPLKPVLLLERIMTILKSYPIENVKPEITNENIAPLIKLMNPDIIITESFTV